MRRSGSVIASPLQLGQILVGRTGIPYHLQKVLYERQQSDDKIREINHKLWLALSNSNYYVVKPVTSFLYNQAFALQKDLCFTPFVRLPVDGNVAHNALIFQHYTEDFMSYVQSGPVSRSQIKRILSDTLKGIAAFHSKDWVHSAGAMANIEWWESLTDVKPNNIMIAYTHNPDGTREIQRVALSDIEDAAKVKKGEAIFIPVGNVLWRSPEAQTGTRIGKASDIWSFGVTAAYGITKLVIFAYDELEDGILPEVEVLSNMLSYFGPLPPALIEHVIDSPWCQVLIALDQSFDNNTPRKPFSLWRDIEGLEPGDKEFLRLAINLAPGLRPAAEELLKHPWFSSP